MSIKVGILYETMQHIYSFNYVHGIYVLVKYVVSYQIGITLLLHTVNFFQMKYVLRKDMLV